MVAVTPKNTANRRQPRASKALAQWSAVTGSQLRFNPNLLPLSSHAIIMECDLLDKGEKQRLRQDGRDALYRAYGRIGLRICLRKQMLY